MTTGVHSGTGPTFVAAGLALAGAIASSPSTLAADYNWTGFYAGANAAYGWGRSQTDGIFTLPAGDLDANLPPGSIADTDTSRFNLNGVFAGGQVGYNWQSSGTVYGIEADLQWSDQKSDTTLVCPATFLTPCNDHAATVNDGLPVTATVNQRLQWFGTVRGRVGALVTPDTLAYLTGGVAYGAVRTDGVFTGYSAGNGPAVTSAYDHTTTKVGWVAGAGVESRIFGGWTGRLEYLYVDLGTVSGTAAQPQNIPPLDLIFSSHVSDNIVRIGLTYNFGDPADEN